MEANNKSSKIFFGAGVFMCLSFGFSIIMLDSDIKNGLGFLVGVYNIWQNGFVKDTTNWKVKPIYFVIAIFILLIIVLNLKINSNSRGIDQSGKESKVRLIDQLVKIKQTLPASIGNQDSIISLKAIGDNTLEYKYKLNTDIKEIDSLMKDEFILSMRKLLLDNIASKSKKEIDLLKKSYINFSHIYLDSNLNLITVIVIDSGDY